MGRSYLGALRRWLLHYRAPLIKDFLPACSLNTALLDGSPFCEFPQFLLLYCLEARVPSGNELYEAPSDQTVPVRPGYNLVRAQ